MNVSTEQALHFLNLLIGSHPIAVDKRGDRVYQPNSPEIRAVLEAVVGPEAVPNGDEYVIRYRLPTTGVPLVKYLEAVTTRLRELVTAQQERDAKRSEGKR